MKEIGILFQDDMSRAIVDRRKTLTSRTRGLEKLNERPDDWAYYGYDPSCKIPVRRHVFINQVKDERIEIRCPYGQPGDGLIGRECWGHTGTGVWSIRDAVNALDGKVIYRATDWQEYPGGLWWPSIHMPYQFSRLRLPVVRVWPSRLQDMTEEMARQEGCEPAGNHNWDGWPKTYLIGYSQLWDRVNAKRGYSWAFNPWVWRVEFKRIKP